MCDATIRARGADWASRLVRISDARSRGAGHFGALEVASGPRTTIASHTWTCDGTSELLSATHRHERARRGGQGLTRSKRISRGAPARAAPRILCLSGYCPGTARRSAWDYLAGWAPTAAERSRAMPSTYVQARRETAARAVRQPGCYEPNKPALTAQSNVSTG